MFAAPHHRRGKVVSLRSPNIPRYRYRRHGCWWLSAWPVYGSGVAIDVLAAQHPHVVHAACSTDLGLRVCRAWAISGCNQPRDSGGSVVALALSAGVNRGRASPDLMPVAAAPGYVPLSADPRNSGKCGDVRRLHRGSIAAAACSRSGRCKPSPRQVFPGPACASMEVRPPPRSWSGSGAAGCAPNLPAVGPRVRHLLRGKKHRASRP